MTELDQPGRARRIAGRVGILLASALVVGSVGSVAWAAATPSPTPSPRASTASSDPDDVPFGRMGPMGRGGMLGKGGMGRHLGGGFGMAGALHGEFTVKKSDGSYQTVLVQQGTVTAVSSSSITVESEDGYRKTYAVTADTLVNAKRDGIGSVTKDDVVHVMATSDGSAVTAVHVMDRTALKDAAGDWLPGKPWATPSRSTSTSGT